MSDLFIFGFSSASTPKIDLSSATITLGPSLTYNGSEQTQTVTSVVVNGTTLVENTDYAVTDNTGINAGDYTLSVVGMGNYTGTATQAWSIAKANGSVSLNPTSLSLDTSNLTGTITVTRSGNGVITAQSSNTSIATVSVSGTSVTVTAVGSGNATVTVSVAAGTNHLATSGTASVNVSLIGALNECTPAQIQAVAKAGTGAQYWSVGAVTAPISIGAVGNMSATSACAFIIGFDHNSSKEGTNRIHFQFGKTTSGTNIAFCDSGYGSSKSSGTWFNMNNGYTNSDGWNGSLMRTVICSAFKSALPSAWQNAIASTTKYTDNTGGGFETASYVTVTTDDIFLLAEYEVFGLRRYANSAEQNYQLQYDYYKNGNAKIFYKHNATSTDCIWWLRSPAADYSDRFCSVGNSGSANFNRARYSYGFAPGFSVA